MSVKATILSIYKKLIKWDKKLEIYTNGEDNQYPERMERLKNNSVTALMASKIMVQYLIGKGFGEADNAKVGNAKLIDFATQVANDIVDNEGYFIHVSYNANLEPADYNLLPFNNCRVGEKDSTEYSGKILVSKDWNEIKKNPATDYNVYNPDKEVLKYQIGIDGKDNDATIIEKVKKFKGQILYVNLNPKYYYPLARIDSVSSECDNEYLAQRYRNTLLRNGFFGKTLVVTRPLVDDSFITFAKDTPEYRREFTKLESEAKEFSNTIKSFVGAENSGGVLHLEVDYAGDDLDKAISFKNIESKIDDKLFEFTERVCTEKILMAYNNLPISLVKSPDSALFGNSGESLRVAKETYWENTSKERLHLETLVNDLMRVKADFVYKDYIYILPLLEKQMDENTALAEKQKAQAVLKGSVGGVTALLEIIGSVSRGETDYNSALAIIKEIYGVDDATARELLGTPNPTSTELLNIINRKNANTN